ncbi:MAG: hypothetical protein ABEJ56_03505 [Candidatus Nanohaloarchaea archaeon]
MTVDTADAVDSAIRKDLNEGEYMLERFRKRLEEFEEEYDMSSEEFMEKFESGELGDDEDFFEWYAVYESMKYWEEKTGKLMEAL